MSKKEEEFLHISGDDDFQNRSRSIFEGLDTLEPPRQYENEVELEDNPLRPPIARGRRRRPPRRVPDHVLHPDKYTKYSLEEDGSDEFRGLGANDLNKHVAMSFMAELEERKQSPKSGTGTTGSGMPESGSSGSDSSKPENASTSERYTFRRHITQKSGTDNSNSSSAISQSKDGIVMMPEYVVGKKAVTPKKRISKHVSEETTKEERHHIGISHLAEEDAEEISAEKSTKEQDQGHSKDKTDSVKNTGEESHKESEESKAVFTKRKHKERKGLRKHARTDEEDAGEGD